ncbi:MAG: hypothetical protein IJG06_06570, partial [Clostridia bacterium]|nr:hypothetical protein [Clostridia bacterium]
MNKLLKKLLSGTVAAVMVIGSLVMPVMADSVTEIPPNLEVNFDTATANYTLEGGAALEENSYGKSLASSSGKYAVINDVSAINTCEGDFTLAITLNPATDAMWTRAYDIGSGTDAYIFLAPSSSFGVGKPRFVIKSATTKTEQALQSTKTLNIGEWNSVVVTRSGSTTKMYVNGEPAGSTTDITYNLKDAGTTTQNWLGRSQYASDPYFSGLIDDFRFYDFAVDEPIAKKYDAIAKSYEEIDAAAKRKQLIYDNNCFIAETHFTRGGEEIFALNNLSSGMYLTDKSLTANQASFTLHDYEKGIDSLQAFVAEYSGSTLVKVTGADIDKETFTGSVTIPFTKENAADTTQLYVWEDMRPVPESKPEDITATVSVKNYTQNSGTVAAYAYAIGGSASNGAETIIQGAADYKEFNSLDEKTLEIPIPLSKIPSDTSKLTIKLTTPKSSGTETAAAATLYRLQNAPVAAPADSNETTNGAHDPSIVKFPGDDTYYVYSSHHLIFTSKDLINWKKYDFTSKNVQTITPKTYIFIHDNLDTNVNGTYWAPDVI